MEVALAVPARHMEEEFRQNGPAVERCDRPNSSENLPCHKQNANGMEPPLTLLHEAH
jgi:hypothetical protein